MAVETALEKFLEIGVQNGYFELSTIGGVKKSCCPKSVTAVIDFDKVKDKLVKEHGLQTLKSCDCLKIISNKERVDFIEMKGMKILIQRPENQPSPQKLSKKIGDTIIGFNLLGKIWDSWLLLNLVASRKEFSSIGESRKKLLEAKKYLVILTDIDPKESAIELIALNLQYLATFSTPIEYQISQLFANALDALPEGLFLNFQKPILRNCNDVDAYYASVSA